MNSASRVSLLVLVVLVLAVSGGSEWLRGRHDRQLGREVAALARPGDIHMLASESCGICLMARAWFREHKVPFSECMIEKDAACRQRFEDHRAPGTPVIVVRGQPQLGFDPGRVQQALQQPRRS
jgi:glutaredoxin